METNASTGRACQRAVSWLEFKPMTLMLQGRSTNHKATYLVILQKYIFFQHIGHPWPPEGIGILLGSSHDWISHSVNPGIPRIPIVLIASTKHN